MLRQNAHRPKLIRTAPEKRVTKHCGMQTTFSLEKAFYEAIGDIAARRGTTIGAIVAQVNADRTGGSLSTALRLFVLNDKDRQLIALQALVSVAATLNPDDFEDSPSVYADEDREEV